MTKGIVNANWEAMIRVELRDGRGHFRSVDATIDTGFTGYLTIPRLLFELLELDVARTGLFELANGEELELDVFDVTVKWFDRERTVPCAITGTHPLLGMKFLAGSDLHIVVETGGDIEIRPLPFSES